MNTTEMMQKARSAKGELSEEELENVSGGGCGSDGKSKPLTAMDMPIGTHVIPYGASYCGYIDKKSSWVVEDGAPPTGCNSSYFITTDFDIATGAVIAVCSGCGRKIRVLFREMRRL